LQAVVHITAMMHGISNNLIEAVSECRALIRHFETERIAISVYYTLHDEAVDLAEQFGAVSYKPRTTGRQRNRTNPQVADTKDYRQITLYYQFL
jgi:hypothetical protein